jgi:tRNA-Thr(GGU) m(6)t(6)A37 methyltransferase TsaA
MEGRGNEVFAMGTFTKPCRQQLIYGGPSPIHRWCEMEAEDSTMEDGSYRIFPIGHVRRQDDHVCLEIEERYRSALKQLDKFSHVIAVWWAHELDNEEARSILTCEPPYAKGHVTGVFACRAEYRPNPIAISTCKVVAVDEDEGRVDVNDIDAMEGTPILDLKAYFPVVDRAKDAHIPEWLSDWPEWLPEEGIGLD